MKIAHKKDLLFQLAELYERYNQPGFIQSDPISVPHRFSKNQDIEISAFFSALLAWGQRTTIIKNLNTLMEGMENAPHDFIRNHKPKDRKRFETFVHRTFQYDDLVYFLEFLQQHYQKNKSLEILFSAAIHQSDLHLEKGLIHFHHSFFSLPHLSRTEKHVSTPERKSACKRLNLFLRWMVRSDNRGVDFGIWKQIKPSQLLCPLDIHVHKAATALGIMNRKQADWTSVLELTGKLREWDADDPVKYDFALFGYSLENKL